MVQARKEKDWPGLLWLVCLLSLDRDSVRAAEVAAELKAALPQGSANIEGMENLEATKMANEMVIFVRALFST